MKINFVDNWIDKKVKSYVEDNNLLQEPQAEVIYHESSYMDFDGEKDPYELGTPYEYTTDYYVLRARAWEAYLKTDFIQNALRKYILWVVGSGLKLQSEPAKEVLELNGINLDETNLRKFTENSEAAFRVFAETKESTFAKNETLHDLGDTALMNSLNAGDCLLVNHYDGNNISTQLIDGGLIVNPFGYIESDTTNRINNGVEYDSKGTIVAYHILQDNLKTKRISARLKDGSVHAWLLTALKNKEQDTRGMSILTAVLQTAAKMDRYKEANLTNAEQSANIVGTIQHDAISDGSNPFSQDIAQAFGKGATSMPNSINDGDIRAPKIAEATNGKVVNMGPGQTYVSHTPKTDMKFNDFFGINLEIVCMTIGIPPEVAKDLFGGAYSGSRAALKSWEYKMSVDRKIKMDRQFYAPIYDFWLTIQILKNKISAPGYLDALVKKDFMVLAAYRGHRFIGATVPHIDPVKEVAAERLKLGKKMENYPLSSVEQSMEALNTGDPKQMINKRIYEDEIAKELDVFEHVVAPIVTR